MVQVVIGTVVGMGEQSMTLALILLAMLAGGMFWYWQALPKQASSKKNARATEAQGKPPVKKLQPAQAPGSSSSSTKNTAIKNTAAQTITNGTATNKYRAVSIHCPSDGCAAARALGERRFLAREAPALPLPECDHAACTCSYAHHADQRVVDDDRRNIHGLQTELYTRTADHERRTRHGRREHDNS